MKKNSGTWSGSKAVNREDSTLGTVGGLPSSYCVFYVGVRKGVSPLLLQFLRDESYSASQLASYRTTVVDYY